MAETTGIDRGDVTLPGAGKVVIAPDVEAWFVREVLPLEAILMQFLRRHCRNRIDVADLCQDVYVRVYEKAHDQIPDRPKSFVLTTARNLLIDRVRKNQVISIQTVADLEALNVAIDEPGPDRVVMARDTLRRLQIALNRLPERCREALVLKKIEGISASDIATRMGISENTVNYHLTHGMLALADSLYGELADSGRDP
ncbi:MAG TPA: RNA polymerase sigma factor [Rhizomicrobium sp.]